MRSKTKLKKDDQVIIISGKEKGKSGKIISFNKTKEKVLVEGRNIISKSVKKNQANPNEQNSENFIKKEAYIDISNVMYYEDGKATRLGFRFEDNKKVRFSKKSGKTVAN